MNIIKKPWKELNAFVSKTHLWNKYLDLFMIDDFASMPIGLIPRYSSFEKNNPFVFATSVNSFEIKHTNDLYPPSFDIFWEIDGETNYDIFNKNIRSMLDYSATNFGLVSNNVDEVKNYFNKLELKISNCLLSPKDYKMYNMVYSNFLQPKTDKYSLINMTNIGLEHGECYILPPIEETGILFEKSWMCENANKIIVNVGCVIFDARNVVRFKL